jgi:hypothetical protein
MKASSAAWASAIVKGPLDLHLRLDGKAQNGGAGDAVQDVVRQLRA